MYKREGALKTVTFLVALRSRSYFNKRGMRNITLSVFLAVCSYMVIAQEAQWRGENRDGVFQDTGLLQSWQEEGPE